MALGRRLTRRACTKRRSTISPRYAATEAGLRRFLERRVDRWARLAQDDAGDADGVGRQASEARRVVRDVVARLAAAGAVNDATFAESRARTLVRAGRSRVAVAAYLAAKGVAADLARSVLPEDATSELAAALTRGTAAPHRPVPCRRRARSGGPPP